MGARILKQLGVFFITVVMFVAVIAPCLDLGEKDVYAASSYTYSAMVRRSITLDEENGKTLDYYLVEPTAKGKYDVVILFSGLYGTGTMEKTFLYYASKWMASKQLKPVVFVIPILEKFGSHKYFRNFVDEKISTPTYPALEKQSYPVTLGTKEYFVLGDNRLNSVDSRYFGIVKAEEIRGIVITVLRRNNL